MAVGCTVLVGQFYFKIKEMRASEIGEDNEMLTAKHDPNWLKSVRKSRGRHVQRVVGGSADCEMPVPSRKGKALNKQSNKGQSKRTKSDKGQRMPLKPAREL